MREAQTAKVFHREDFLAAPVGIDLAAGGKGVSRLLSLYCEKQSYPQHRLSAVRRLWGAINLRACRGPDDLGGQRDLAGETSLRALGLGTPNRPLLRARSRMPYKNGGYLSLSFSPYDPGKRRNDYKNENGSPIQQP